MCLKSPWSSMGVTGTRVPVRWEGTGSGRRGFWHSLREILSLCQFPSCSLANPLLLWFWVVLSVLPSPLPSWHRQRRSCKTWKSLAISGTTWHRRLVRLKRVGEDVSAGAGPEVSCERRVGESGARAPNKKDELAQLEARKEMFEASGFAPGVSVRAPGCPWVLQLSQVHPKRKRNKKDTLACPHKRDRSTISHT